MLGSLGASFTPPGGVLGPLGMLLGASLGILSWGPLGASCGPLGAEGLDFRLAFPPLGLPWGRLGVRLSRRGRLWRRLPTLLSRLGALLEAS